MKGLQPLFLGIFGIIAFSWFGMAVVPNLSGVCILRITGLFDCDGWRGLRIGLSMGS